MEITPLHFMLWAKNATPSTVLLCTCPAKTLPLHLTPNPLLQRELCQVGVLSQFLSQAATCWLSMALQK